MPDATIKLRNPTELVAAIPYLIGFHPADCFVVCGLVSESPVLHLRVDDTAASDLGRLSRVLAGHLKRAAAERVILIAYGRSAAESAGQLSTLLHDGEVSVLDVLTVVDGRWRSIGCEDPDCCPIEGNAAPASDQLPVVAQLVAAGRVARSSRAALVSDLNPVPGRQAQVAELLERSVAGRRAGAEGLQLWRQVVTAVAAGQSLPEPQVCAEMLSNLQDVSVRDAVMALLVEAPDTYEPLLTWLASAAPRPVAAPVLTLAALPAWLRGDGARAAQALEMALAADSEYRLAQLLECGLSAGLPPAEIAAICRHAAADDDPPAPAVAS